MMSFWEIFEELGYIYYMLGPYQAVIFMGILFLSPPFIVSLYCFFRSRMQKEQAWYLVTMINFITNLLISTQTSSLFISITALIFGQIIALSLISHLVVYEE